jgi:glycylpeptide N-tetradecanoyltransferase
MSPSTFWIDKPTGIAVEKSLPGIIKKFDDAAADRNPVYLPDNLTWKDVLPSDQQAMRTLETFLAENYVTDDDSKFRLGYSFDFLVSFLSEAHICRNEPNSSWSVGMFDRDGKQMGYVAAVKRTVSLLRTDPQVVVEVNFLCVERNHRNTAWATTLIKEITRRVQMSGIEVALFTCSWRLPIHHFVSGRMYHKFLDVDALNAVGYTNFSKEELPEAKKKWQHRRVPPRINRNVARCHILRQMKREDVSMVAKMFAAERCLYAVVEWMSEERLSQLLDRSYLQHFVVEELNVIERQRKVVGYVSVRDTELIVLDGKKEQTVKSATIHYQCGVVSPVANQLLTLLKTQGSWVVNAVNVASNAVMIKQEEMLPGTGELFYYTYNYRLPVVQPWEVNYHVL